jgi:hypothetical protein
MGIAAISQGCGGSRTLILTGEHLPEDNGLFSNVWSFSFHPGTTRQACTSGSTN